MHWPRETRAKIALYIILFGFVILAGRLVSLQVVKAGYYKKISDENRIRSLPRPAFRGLIYDRQGRQLVTNRASFTVALIPYEIRGNTQILSRASNMLGLDSTWLKKKLESRRYSAHEPIPVVREADFVAISRIAEQSENLPGVVFQDEPTRKYPQLKGSSHMLGYVSEISEDELKDKQRPELSAGARVGKMGIEKEYDLLLRGRDGVDFYEVSASGRVIGKLPDQEDQLPSPGLDLVLSLDFELQARAESLLAQYPRGCVIALEPNSGEVLCLVSQPGFDANSFASVLSPQEWLDLVEDPNHPLLNRATQSAYPPGSTLKLLVAGAALETGLLTPSTTFRPCNGGYQFGKRFFRCWDPQGHGTQDLKGAILHSCDTYFYQVGLKAGVDLIADYARRCGFGEKLGIDLPEESRGFVPTTGYYDKKFGKRGWTKSLALNLAIGQGEFLTTPLQITSFFGALSNGGIIYRPHLLKKIISRQGRVQEYEKTVIGRLPFSKSTLEFLSQACLAVVSQEGGTGRLARLGGIDVAGKTGSAQNPHGNTHSWFVGYAPAENPRIVVTVLIENAGHGGDVSAPMAREIIAAYLQARQELAEAPKTPE